jgi:succinyl-diaminopimelate desuccinylase
MRPGYSIQKELISLTSDLIKIPSTHSRPDEIHRCAQKIEQYLETEEITYQKVIHNNIPSLLILPTPSYAPLLFVTHFDVVEATDEEMFTPRVNSDCLYGRGAIDDKYAVALSLTLFKEKLQQLKTQRMSQTDMTFGLLLTGDEEVGGENGTGAVVDTIDTDFFIALDGGAPDHIVTKEKGIMLLELSAKGKEAHASRPWLGKNAMDLLLADYRVMQQLFPENTTDRWHRTMALTRCNVGNGSTNMIPGKGSASFDIRFTENDNPEELIAEIRTRVSSTVTVKAMAPVFNSTSSHHLQRLSTLSEKISIGAEHGASDARYFSARNVPGAIWGADGQMSAHTDNEHLLLPSFFKLYDHLDTFITIG